MAARTPSWTKCSIHRRQSIDGPPTAGPALEVPEALDERLRALGYIE
jgi:hypothetical protein